MKNTQHGLSIGINRVANDFFMTLKISGKLTHEDYQEISPMLDAAVKGIASPKVKALVDLSEMQGWELRAMWDDLKLGLKHGSEFTKIAVIGNQQWQHYAAKVGSWFMHGEIQYFEESSSALSWLQQEG